MRKRKVNYNGPYRSMLGEITSRKRKKKSNSFTRPIKDDRLALGAYLSDGRLRR